MTATTRRRPTTLDQDPFSAEPKSRTSCRSTKKVTSGRSGSRPMRRRTEAGPPGTATRSWAASGRPGSKRAASNQAGPRRLIERLDDLPLRPRDPRARGRGQKQPDQDPAEGERPHRHLPVAGSYRRSAHVAQRIPRGFVRNTAELLRRLDTSPKAGKTKDEALHQAPVELITRRTARTWRSGPRFGSMGTGRR